jgi:hypothetical protein
MKRNLSPYTGCEERQLILLIRSDRSLYGAFCFGIMMFEYFKAFWIWADENPDKVNTTSAAMYFHFLHIANSLRWKESFGVTAGQTMSSLGIGSVKTYRKHFEELIESGLIEIKKRSVNQYSCHVIALPKITQPTTDHVPNQLPTIDLTNYLSDAPIHKTNKTTKDYKDFQDINPDSIESNPVTIKPDLIQLYTPSPQKKKVPQKKKDHRFADSIYADDPDLFIEHWMQTETARAYPDTDPLKVYTTLKTSSDASSKYTYANWISAAQNWVKRNPAEYKRTFTTANGHQLHHNDQAIIDRVERLTRNTF